ncbi:Hypothetical protein PYTT_1913 [Akkermansia glycaniphila]|uniref:CT398-like coiled coil hairpin domain-containing protein n=2 Tax=Akkermansia glycaniphila TaxID=1679444 RepID=A0A1C7P9D7_9BACT|nr:hypothetical protein AC781_12955 [Akkermansia glycaniphila]SEH94068.1 Hypothetical protein PYTT_1913 [Akkermansia glycaniphila]
MIGGMEHRDLTDLLILQERDMQIVKLQRSLKAIPEQRTQLMQRAKDREKALLAARKAAQEHELSIKQIELEVKSKEALLAKLKIQQMETRKNDEYLAFASQIDTTASLIGDLETQQLELMERQPALQEAEQAARQRFEAARTSLKEQLAKFDAASERDGALVKQLLEERKALRAKVEPELLATYESIGKSRGLPVVIELPDDGVCPGCNMQVTEDVRGKVLIKLEVERCPNCGRILR